MCSHGFVPVLNAQVMASRDARVHALGYAAQMGEVMFAKLENELARA